MRTGRMAIQIAVTLMALVLAFTSVRLTASPIVLGETSQKEREEDPESGEGGAKVELKAEFVRVRHRLHSHPPGPCDHALDFAFAEPPPPPPLRYVPAPVKVSPRRQT